MTDQSFECQEYHEQPDGSWKKGKITKVKIPALPELLHCSECGIPVGCYSDGVQEPSWLNAKAKKQIKGKKFCDEMCLVNFLGN